MDWLYTIVGLVILLLSGDSLVKGAVNLSLRLGVPALIVSLTIVAFGTSAPELLISIQAIWDGVPGLALGNVVGSNTANVLLVLGIPALLATMHTSECDTRTSYLQMMAATALFIVLAFFGPLTWISGVILLAALTAMLLHAARSANAHRKACECDPDIEGADPKLGWPKIALFLVLGLIGLPLGANLLVEGATSIAREFGISETVIGLTLVAIGTSLPELATTVMAALRRQAEKTGHLKTVDGCNCGEIHAASFTRPTKISSRLLCCVFMSAILSPAFCKSVSRVAIPVRSPLVS